MLVERHIKIGSVLCVFIFDLAFVGKNCEELIFHAQDRVFKNACKNFKKKEKRKKTDGSYVIKPEGDLIIFPAVTLNLLLERQYSVHVLETTEVTSS